VISLIDTLYYLPDPELLMKQIFERLNSDGLVIMRVVNRNWLVKFNKYVLRKATVTALIDHSIGYSKKSISYLLKSNGFEIIKMTNWEKGKKHSFRTKAFYLTAFIVKLLSLGFINIFPGLILIAKKTNSTK